MRVNIYCCLVAFVLGSNITADLIHKVIKEKQTVVLSCPLSVEGKVRWSRESEGRKADILTVDGDGDIKHINDPDRRYASWADRSLYVSRAALSDSGKYLCNDEAAAELTVIPSGTMMHIISERTEVVLNCPDGVIESDVPVWSRKPTKNLQNGSRVSPVDRMLMISDARPGDSGLYSCDGKPAVYLHVVKEERSDRGLVCKILEEKQMVILHCLHSVEGKVTWSRESEGRKVDILTTDDDGDIKHINDEGRYGSLADGSLFIVRTAVSDSGTYLCNNEAAVELTVIPSGRICIVSRRTNIVLYCPNNIGGSGVPTWSRELIGTNQQKIPHVSTVEQMLIITDAQPGDAGLYYCDEKPAVYVDVIKDERADRGMEKTTSATLTAPSLPLENPASAYLWQTSVRTVLGLLYLIIMTSITVVTWRKARELQKDKRDRTRN